LPQGKAKWLLNSKIVEKYHYFCYTTLIHIHIMTVTLPALGAIQPKDVYNCIMVQIEPDLITTNVNTLHSKYAGESAEQTTARIERYAKARAEYKRELELYLQQNSQRISQEQKIALEAIELESRATEQEQLALIENFFNT
jgi:hypothetical protein